MKTQEFNKENVFSTLLPINLQLFADGDMGNNNGDQSQSGDNSDEGTSEDEKDPSEGASGRQKSDKTGGATKTFTQADLNKIGKQEKASGRKSAFKDLGFEDEKTAKAEMEAYRAWKESQKTEEEKKAEALNSANTKAQEAEQRALRAEAKVTALSNGVNPAGLDDVIELALTKVTDDKSLEDVLKEMKENTLYSSFFTTSEEQQNSGSRGTGSSSGNHGTGASGSKVGIGTRLAQSSKSSSSSGAKSSYFRR